MTTTVRMSAPTGEWTEIASGSESVLIQMVSSYTAEVVVAAALPTESDIGVRLENPDRPTLSLSTLAATDKVYIRPVLDYAVTFTVIKS